MSYPMETAEFIKLVQESAHEPAAINVTVSRHSPMPNHLGLWFYNVNRGFNVPYPVIPEYRISPGPNNFIHAEGWRWLLERLISTQVIEETPRVRALREERSWSSTPWG